MSAGEGPHSEARLGLDVKIKT